MSYKSILMAVEPDFNGSHIGVLRVIRHHFKDLVARGHRVTLATYRDGEWITCSMLDAARAILDESRRKDMQKPYWQSGTVPAEGAADVAPHDRHWTIKWDGPAVSPEHFDESILTNPWLCANAGMPIADSKFTLGIVYDMVPNLIALGMLRMPQFIDVYHFAHAHHIGYDYFLRNVRTISCISESTRQDFKKLYDVQGSPALEVCIPFSDFGTAPPRNEPDAQDVLMINVLDHRKNFLTAAKALKEAAASVKLNVVIVGRERLARDDVFKFLSEISKACASVRWYRSPSDAQLMELMTKAKVVFFPSFYEGLGLPILEAQARGVPVISSHNSSCGEINLNSVLTADAYDYRAFAAKLTGLLKGDQGAIAGPALRDAQLAFLNGRNQLFTS